MSKTVRWARRASSALVRIDSTTRFWLVALICAAAYTVVFAVPWHIPVGTNAVLSDSQAAGFSNKTAVLGLGVCMALLGLLAFTSKTAAPYALIALHASADPKNRVGRGVFATIALINTAAIWGLGWLFGSYPVGDAAYFIDRTAYLVAGSRYGTFEFSYGPLLLYPQYLLYRVLHPLGVGLPTSYYVWFVAYQLIGLAALALILNRLSLSRATRTMLFCLVGLSQTIITTLGLNYALVRFLAPYALLLIGLGWLFDADKPLWRRVMSPALASVIGYLVSPELGIALWIALTAATAVAWGDCDRRLRWSTLFAVSGVPIALVAGFSRAATIGGFAGGAFYFPILPGPMALLYVAMMLAIAGLAVPALGIRDIPSRSALAGWLAIAVVMVAPALGRADIAHMYWNGLGAALLLTAAISRNWKWAARPFAILFVGLYFIVQIQGGTLFLPQAVVAGAQSGALSEAQFVSISRWPIGYLNQLNYAAVMQARITPAEIDYVLKRTRVAVPSPVGGDLVTQLAMKRELATSFTAPENLLTPAQCELELENLAHADSLVMTPGYYQTLMSIASLPATAGDMLTRPGGFVDTSYYQSLMLIQTTIKARNPDFVPMLSFAREVRDNWVITDGSSRLLILQRAK